MPRRSLFWPLYHDAIWLVPVALILTYPWWSEGEVSALLGVGAWFYGVIVCVRLKQLYASSLTLILPTSERELFLQALQAGFRVVAISTLPVFVLTDVVSAIYLLALQLCVFVFSLSSLAATGRSLLHHLQSVAFIAVLCLLLSLTGVYLQSKLASALWLGLAGIALASLNYAALPQKPPRRLLRSIDAGGGKPTPAGGRIWSWPRRPPKPPHLGTEPSAWWDWPAVIGFENRSSRTWSRILVVPLALGLLWIVTRGTNPESWRPVVEWCLVRPPQSLQTLLVLALTLSALWASMVGSEGLQRLNFRLTLRHPLSRSTRANSLFAMEFYRTATFIAGALLCLFAPWYLLQLLADCTLSWQLLLPYLRALAWILLWVTLWRILWRRLQHWPFYPSILLIFGVTFGGGVFLHGLNLPETGAWRSAALCFSLAILAQGLLWLSLRRHYRQADLA